MKKVSVSSLLTTILFSFLTHSPVHAVAKIKWERLPSEGIDFVKLCLWVNPKDKKKWKVWGLDSQGIVYKWNHDNYKSPGRGSGRLKQFSIGRVDLLDKVNTRDQGIRNPKDKKDRTILWGTNQGGGIYRWNWTKKNWARFRGNKKQVSVGRHANIWGINKGKQVYEKAGRGWRHIKNAPKLISIAVGPAPEKHARRAMVWGVDDNSKIYEFEWHRDLKKAKFGNPKPWDKNQGILNKVFIGDDGRVWAGTVNNFIYLWSNGTWLIQWNARKFKKIITHPDGKTLFGITPQNLVYKQVNDIWEPTGLAFKDIAFPDKNNIWGITSTDRIFVYKKGVWKKETGVPESQDIAVDKDGDLWYAAKIKESYGVAGDPFTIDVQKVATTNKKKKANYFYAINFPKIGLKNEGPGFVEKMASGQSIWILSDKKRLYQMDQGKRAEITPAITVGKSTITHMAPSQNPRARPWILAEQDGKSLIYQQNPKNKTWKKRGLPNFKNVQKSRKAKETRRKKFIEEQQKNEEALETRFKAYKSSALGSFDAREEAVEIKNKEKAWQKFAQDQKDLLEKKGRIRSQVKATRDDRIRGRKAAVQREIDDVEKDIKNETDPNRLPPLLTKLQMLRERKRNVEKVVDAEIEVEIIDKEQAADQELANLETAKTQDEQARKADMETRRAALKEKLDQEAAAELKAFAERKIRFSAQATENIDPEKFKDQPEFISELVTGNQGWFVTKKKLGDATYYPEDNVFYWRKWWGKWGWGHASGSFRTVSVGPNGKQAWGITADGGIARRVR